jgi:hypothetical protein
VATCTRKNNSPSTADQASANNADTFVHADFSCSHIFDDVAVEDLRCLFDLAGNGQTLHADTGTDCKTDEDDQVRGIASIDPRTRELLEALSLEDGSKPKAVLTLDIASSTEVIRSASGGNDVWSGNPSESKSNKRSAYF